MNKQFTPGPWMISKEDPQQNQYGIFGIDIDAPNENVRSLSTVWGSREGIDPVGYADIRLISAAPEMFELLEKFCEQCNKHNIESLIPEYEQAMALLQRITNPQH